MNEIVQPIRVLFLCTHNAARSQMAEALLRHIGGERFEVWSAGSEVTRVHPLTVRAMADVGIDIADARSKHLSEFIGDDFDYVITVCNRSGESCPIFPGDPERVHWSFTDPSAAEGSEDQRFRVFARVRDEIMLRLRTWIQLPLVPMERDNAT